MLTTMPRRPAFPRRFAGMSLVELMVGMVIGLIGIVIITHLYLVNEEYKRSTTGSGTAQVNGAIALFSLERDVRMSGYGIAHSNALGCSCAGAGCSPVQYFYNNVYSYPPAGAAAGALQALNFVPVMITQGFAGTTDALTVLYSGSQQRMLPGTLQENMPNAGSNFKVDGTTGYAVGDMVVVAQGANCVMAQVTAIQTGASQIEHTANTRNPAAGGTLNSFTQGASVFNLGKPVWRQYSVASNQLQVQDLFGLPAGVAAQPIVEDIVDLQAEYGKDDGVAGGTADDGLVDSWDTVVPTTVAGWRRVLAIRIGVLARSGNFERPATPGGACTATTATPTWSGSATAGGVSVFTLPDGLPSCYKYRVFETVIPLRNMIWLPI
jgi:type IV pilus assembly protein PilW